MRTVIQRVTRAAVHVDGTCVGRIDHGLLALVGITHDDTMQEVAWMAEKLLSLRVFPDDDGKMNRNVVDAGGGLLLVSQFTLYGNLRKGTRPSFIEAARPEVAQPLFDALVATCKAMANGSVPVQQGIFGAMMQVELVNDGPVTVILERHAKDSAAG